MAEHDHEREVRGPPASERRRHQVRADPVALPLGQHRHRGEREHLVAGREPRAAEEDVADDVLAVDRHEAQLGHARAICPQRVDEPALSVTRARTRGR